MLKIVLAEDEINVLQLIKSLIDQRDVEIIGEAMNGLDAYNLVCEKTPDLLITDIRMPLLNGIELIERTRRALPDLEIVVISGYREFDYVQSGLKYGVQEYLLKPVEKKELNGVIERVIQKKRGISDQQQHVKDIERNLESAVALLQKEYLNKLFVSNLVIDDFYDFKSLFNLESGNYCIAILKVDFRNMYAENPTILNPILVDISKAIIATVKSKCYNVLQHCHGTRMFFLFNYPGYRNEDAFWSKPEDQISKLKNILINEGYKYSSLKFTFGVGRTVSQVEELPFSYETAKKVIENRIDPAMPAAAEFESLHIGMEDGSRQLVSEEKLEQFAGLVLTLDTERIMAFFQEIVEKDVAPSKRFSCIYRLVFHFLKVIRNVIIANNLVKEEEFQDQAEIVNRIDCCGNYSDLYMCFKQYVTGLMDFCRDLSEKKASRPIRIAQQYVDENYASVIRLQDISSKVFMSPSYFSTVFKSQTGLNFVDYVNKVRVGKAKELLRKSLKNVSEIAYAVGFSDVTYFSKLFIRTVGIKPSEYRKSYS